MTKKKVEEEEAAAASYSMNNDDDDYLCSNNDHNIDNNNNNTNLKHERRAWGTWEELLLACAVKRHGFCDWDSVATEVRTRTSLSSVFISADDCRLKYRDLQRRFKEPADGDNDATAAKKAAEEEGGNDIPWLEELRSLRVAELRREVEQYDVSILSLQLKVKKLEEEERDGGGKLDLGEEERKRERSGNDGGDKAAEESERENRSMNESNSTGSGEKTAGEDEPGKARGDDLDPDPVNTAGEEGSEASGSGELGESGTSGRQWKRKRGKDSDGEIRSAASKSQPLIRLLDLIRSHPRGSLFERRVRSQETEDYKSLVKQHLDMETIQRKLKQGTYDSSKLTFYRDLQLIFANAVTFFPSSSSESMAAHELRAIVSEEMRKESGKPSPRVLKASAGMTSIKADAAEETSEQKSSAPLVVCKRRRFVSAKAKASPSSSSFSQREETKEETLSEENANEDMDTGGRSSKRTANNTKTGKGKSKAEAKTEKKVVVSSDKKKSVADFLKRIKKSSPQKEDKDQSKSKKESKPKPRELRSNNVGRKKRAEVESATPAKRAPGRPPQKKPVEAVATASGKRGRESGSTGKDNKQPKKRSKR